MNVKLAGTYAALLTGFSDDGAFDPERQRNILRYVAAQDIDGLYVGGTSAEDGLMETAELRAQQEAVAEFASPTGRRLIAHVGRPNPRAAIELARSAEGLGFHAVSALPPHAYPFSDKEIVAYYEALADATSLPLIAYEIPVRTGRPLDLTVLERVLDVPNVVGLKFTSTDLFKMSRLIASRPDAMIFHGYDETALAGAALGAHGGIGTTYNVIGGLYSALFAAVRQGDLELARSLQTTSQTLVVALLATGVLPGCKIALQTLGIDCGPCRRPFSAPSVEAAGTLRSVLERRELTHWTTKALDDE